jgi:hypothetical protein
MTAKEFRKIVLSLPETEERAHMNHPDFRVAAKIFATLGYTDKTRAMVKLSLEDQHNFAKDYPEAFIPVKGTGGPRRDQRLSKGCEEGNCSQSYPSRLAQHRSQALAEQKGLIQRDRSRVPELTQSSRAPKINMKPGCPSQPSHTHATLRIRM